MKKNARITIRLPSETSAALRAAAAKRDRKLNWLVVRILEQWIARQLRRK